MSRRAEEVSDWALRSTAENRGATCVAVTRGVLGQSMLARPAAGNRLRGHRSRDRRRRDAKRFERCHCRQDEVVEA